MALFKEIWCEAWYETVLESAVDDMKLCHHLGRMHDQPLTGISCVTSCALLKKRISGGSNTHTATSQSVHHDSLWEGLAGFRDCILHARHDITPHCRANNLPSTQQVTKTHPKQNKFLSLSFFIIFKCRFVAWQRGFPWKCAHCVSVSKQISVHLNLFVLWPVFVC